jgi:CO/xanthine dehydrogenase Mo-binding subunit
VARVVVCDIGRRVNPQMAQGQPVL